VSQEREDPAVPVVGIGASAGGLEAFTSLVKHLPSDTGLAFVLIQHLDPKHESMLGDILSRSTGMPVEEVRDGMAMQANHVYVIPPNTSMTVSAAGLQLLPREQSSAPQMPIDRFLRSLAECYKNRAIAVILSGTGSDGALGVEAVKAEGGITFAQDEKSAKFDAMPRHALATGCVDFILPPEKIATELARIGQHPYVKDAETAEVAEASAQTENAFTEIFDVLRAGKGVDFSLYKQSTVKRRIRRRLALQRVESLEEYAACLEEKPVELDALYQEILIKVTSFFRDAEAFEALTSTVVPSIWGNRSAGDPIRIWVPGCATGEEAYSIAICMLESMNHAGLTVPIQIFASDISDPSIEKARSGLYLENVAADISPERLSRYFVRTATGYQVSKAIRELCVFTRQDLINDPPFSRLDLISCRNVLIYLAPPIQKKLFPVFHYALRANGFLMLGASETARSFPDLFAPIDPKRRVYRKREISKKAHFRAMQGGLALEGPSARPRTAPMPQEASARSELQKKVDHALLSKYNPSGVVIDEDMEILEIRGQAGRYLEPAPGRASLNLLKMAQPARLALECKAALQEAKQKAEPARRERIKVEQDGQFKDIDVEVIPLDPADRRTFLVLFEESSVHAGEPSQTALTAEERLLRDREMQILKLKQEVAATREHLLSIIESHEIARDESQISTEETLSINEELQSINEELETAKEELHATNEELIAVNEELQSSNTALQHSSDFALAIVNTVPQPLLVLDIDLRVRKANEAFYGFFGKKQEQTERRSIWELAGSGWDTPELRKLLEHVLPSDGFFTNFEAECTIPGIGRKTMILSGHQLVAMQMILVAIQDVSGQREAQAALRMTEEHLRQAQKMEVIGRLAGGIAHDFNNLLTVILGHSEMLLESAAGEADRMILDEIRAAGERAASLTQQLLAFSRRQVLQPKLLDVHAILMDFEKMLRRLIGEHIELVIHCQPALGYVRADPGQLGRAIMNLALNARDAMPQGGTLAIDAINLDLNEAQAAERKLTKGGYIMLAVADTGIGMDPETQSHLFEPFFTTKDKEAGTGLGLPVVYGIVEQTGGAVRFHSEVGRGTTFRIYLPRAADPVEEAPPSHVREEAPRGTETVLLVEDEGGVRRLAKIMMEQCGYTVLEASNGREAISICESREDPIHLLLTDVVMPGMGGRELADRAVLLRSQMKVLFMSGHTNDIILEQGIAEGAPFLQKPFSKIQLTRKVRDTLDGKTSAARQA
jgi:two-component system CheB/CheR fusion protein